MPVAFLIGELKPRRAIEVKEKWFENPKLQLEMEPGTVEFDNAVTLASTP